MHGFWEEIDRQLVELRTATSAADVFRILGSNPDLQDGRAHAFFGGGGGDGRVDDSLREAGWTFIAYEAWYYWAAKAPNGDVISYVEGDVYLGTQLATT